MTSFFNSPNLIRIAAWALVAIGAALRIARWAAGRSLWYDEILLADNIISRPIGRLLFVKLDQWQAAPAGFLLVEKLIVDCFGSGERTLRLFPLLCGLASLLIFRSLALRLLNRAGALLAIAIFAFAGPYIYYSSEVKQYSGDVLAAVALLLAGWNALAALNVDSHSSLQTRAWPALSEVFRQREAWRALTPLAIVGGVAMFFSHPATFTMAGLWCVLVLYAWRAGRRDWLATLGCIAIGWSVLLAIDYLLFLRLDTDADIGAGLIKTWELLGGFPPRYIAGWPGWLWYSWRQLFGGFATLWLVNVDIAVTAALIGVVALGAENRRVLAMLLTPFVFAIAAAATRKYPFADRLALFITPSALLMLGAGFDLLQRGVGAGLSKSGQPWQPVRGLVVLILAAMLLSPSVSRAMAFLQSPPGREETEPVLGYIGAHAQPGDILFCCDGAHPSYRYYKTAANVDRMNVIWAPRDLSNSVEAGEIIHSLHGRVWFFFTHVWNEKGQDEASDFEQTLDGAGTKRESYAQTGAETCLYQLP